LSALNRKFHLAICGCKQRVIAAHLNIGAGMKSGATLAHKDIACDHGFTAVLLYAKIFWVRIVVLFLSVRSAPLNWPERYK